MEKCFLEIVTSGVQRGLVLSSLLLMMYINNLDMNAEGNDQFVYMKTGGVVDGEECYLQATAGHRSDGKLGGVLVYNLIAKSWGFILRSNRVYTLNGTTTTAFKYRVF